MIGIIFPVLQIEQLEYLIHISRVKTYTCKIRFTKLLSKFYNRGWIYKYVINGYNNANTDIVLNFLEDCERDYMIGERRLLKLKEEMSGDGYENT